MENFSSCRAIISSQFSSPRPPKIPLEESIYYLRWKFLPKDTARKLFYLTWSETFKWLQMNHFCPFSLFLTLFIVVRRVRVVCTRLNSTTRRDNFPPENSLFLDAFEIYPWWNNEKKTGIKWYVDYTQKNDEVGRWRRT